MTQDKMRRVITACVSAGTILIVLLLSVLIYQWITIANLNAKEEIYEADIASYEQQLKQAKKDLTFYESELGINCLLIQQGYVKAQGE